MGEDQHAGTNCLRHCLDAAKCWNFAPASRCRPSVGVAHGSGNFMEWIALQLASISFSQSALTSAAGRSRLEMSGPFMTRYVSARHYLYFGVTALVLAAFSAWLGL